MNKNVGLHLFSSLFSSLLFFLFSLAHSVVRHWVAASG
jgi:hypothetical protein